MRIGTLVFALLVAVAASGAAVAQVEGVCVSGCNIPGPPSQGPGSPPGPQIDPRLLVVGVTAQIRGDVTFIYPNGERVKATNMTPIVLGAKVETGPDAKVSFLLLDETSFTIGPNSAMTIDRFVYDPKEHADVSLRVMKGAFRWITGHVARKPPGEININTPIITIGIRGTDLEIEANPDGSGFVALHEGEIVVEEYDTNKPITIHAGQTVWLKDFKIARVQ